MKIVIIGGCGYIGTAITDLLAKENHELVVIDQNLAETKIAGVQYCECDLLDIERTLSYVSCASAIVFSALPSFSSYEHSPELNNLRSSVFVNYLANLVQMTGATLITLSDWRVYGRLLSLGSEDEIPKPNCEFSRYLNYFENMTRTMVPDSVIVRLGEVWGYETQQLNNRPSQVSKATKLLWFSLGLAFVNVLTDPEYLVLEGID